MAKCNICQKQWWFSKTVKCDCAKTKQMTITPAHRSTLITGTVPPSTPHNFGDNTLQNTYLNDWNRNTQQTESTGQDNSHHHSSGSNNNDHRSDSCHSGSDSSGWSSGSSDSGYSSGSDCSSSSSSSSDY